MDKFLKSEKNFKTALELLEVVNQTTADYFFVSNLTNDTSWFFGSIDEKYDIRKKGCPTNTTAELLNVVHPADKKLLMDDVEKIAKGEKSEHNINYRWIDRNGKVVWVNCTGRVIYDEESKPYIMIGRVSEEALRHLYNPMTGLWNKVKLREDLKELLATGSKYLMKLDIRSLASINLSHGREFGDALLKEIADRLEGLPLVSKAYHTDHSNFVAVVDSDNVEDIKNTYSEICEVMIGKCSFTAGAVPIDSSVFVDASQLLDSVNVTLNKAKVNPIDSIEIFSEEDIKARIKAFVLLEELKSSVQNDFEGFELHYQPQVKGGSYDLYGVEALLRYNSKKRGRVFPDEFIPVLEQSRLIEQVGLWVLKQSLLQCKEWRKNIPLLNVSVNFSSVQFEDKHLGEKIVETLKATDMPGDALTIEVTESIQIHSTESFNHIMRYLKAFGIKFAIDDFGTGYSNLGYLKEMNANEIKIDRSFISELEKDSYNYKLISNVIEFAKANNIRVCCEGVETNEELAILEVLRPDVIQGYFFDKPCTIDEFVHKYINTTSDAFKERLNFIEEVYKYNESIGIIHFDVKNILRDNNIGLWVMRIDKDKKHYELHIDDTMENTLNIKNKLTATECFDYWHSKISTNDVEHVNQNLDVMTTDKKMVLFKYKWNHPMLGNITVKFSGIRTKDSDGMVVLEGYHRILDDVEEL